MQGPTFRLKELGGAGWLPCTLEASSPGSLPGTRSHTGEKLPGAESDLVRMGTITRRKGAVHGDVGKRSATRKSQETSHHIF